LWAHLVPGREQEQVEEDDLYQRMDLDAQLTNEHAREQSSNYISEFERSKPQPPQQESHRQSQKYCELGIMPQRRGKICDHAMLRITVSNTAAS
jgi:hypothetical protein